MSRLLEPAEGQPVFELSFATEPSHIDENGHVNNVVYLDWVQQIAIAHWRAKAPAEEQAQHAWIVLRHEVDYRRPLKLGETAHARTWVAREAEGPRFERYVRVDGPDGAMCAQAKTVWCLIDPASGRPKRVPAWMVELFA